MFKTANDETYEAWIFDTVANFHIKGDFSHLLEPIRCHVGLKVGGRAWLHATNMRSVQLYIEIGGRVLSVALSEVVKVHE